MNKTPASPSGSREMHSRLRRNTLIILQIGIIFDRGATGGRRSGGVDVVNAEGGKGIGEWWGVGG